MGSINTYNKVCSNLNTSPVEDPKLSLVSQLYFEFMFLILTLCFVLGFDRLFILTLPLWYTKIFIFLYFYSIYTTPTSQSHCVSFYRQFVPINNGFHKFIFLSEGKHSYIFINSCWNLNISIYIIWISIVITSLVILLMLQSYEHALTEQTFSQNP